MGVPTSARAGEGGAPSPALETRGASRGRMLGLGRRERVGFGARLGTTLAVAARMPVRIEPHDRFIRVHFDGHDLRAVSHADFHWMWLRLACAQERHPATDEPTLCPSRVAPSIHAKAAWVDGDALVVEWEGEPPSRPPSRYSLGWLAEHAYAIDRPSAPAPPLDAGPFEAPATVDGLFPSGWLDRIERDGALIVRGGADTASPAVTERWIEQLERAGLGLVETHFGRIEDLRTDNTTNANTDQLGYTDAAIDLHTDQPFLDEPPRYQLLHCVRAADRGGESTLADARAAAEWIRLHDADAYRALTRLPVTFHRKQKEFERVVARPIFETDEGRFIRVRHSYFTMAPQSLPFEHLEPFYGAYRTLARTLDLYRIETALRPGDALLYDNHRMLHGRRAFSGRRWMRGVYFDSRRAA